MVATEGHRSLLLAARELLIDLERTDLNSVIDIVRNSTPGTESSPSKAPPPPPPPPAPSGASNIPDGHKDLLLKQVDEYRESLQAEQQACEELREENSRLATDLRSLAAMLKQERAASNAVLQANHAYAEDSASMSAPDTSGLSLASAASQILLLRREVKFLQKRWNSARVDQDAASTREQMQQLRDETAEAKKAAAAAEEAASSSAARSRLLLRELKAARAQVRAQHERMIKRSQAQKEVAVLKEQLSKAREDFVTQQQTLKQLQLRERLRRPVGDDDDDDEGESGLGGGGGGFDTSALEEEVAHSGLGLLLLSSEITLLERAWMQERGAAAELVAIKSNMSFRIAQVEDDNNDLQAEVGRLKKRVAALQEEKEVMQTSLNALNVDLAERPEEQQQQAADQFAAATSEMSQHQPALAAQAQAEKDAQKKNAFSAAAGAAKAVGKMKFSMKKKSSVEKVDP